MCVCMDGKGGEKAKGRKERKEKKNELGGKKKVNDMTQEKTDDKSFLHYNIHH